MVPQGLVNGLTCLQKFYLTPSVKGFYRGPLRVSPEGQTKEHFTVVHSVCFAESPESYWESSRCCTSHLHNDKLGSIFPIVKLYLIT